MKKSLIAAALSLGLFASSCIGPNNAFNKLHEWNDGATDNKWADEGIYVAFWILPVYPLCLAADILVFNSIEWWGGENPVGK